MTCEQGCEANPGAPGGRGPCGLCLSKQGSAQPGFKSRVGGVLMKRNHPSQFSPIPNTRDAAPLPALPAVASFLSYEQNVFFSFRLYLPFCLRILDFQVPLP